MGGVLTQLRPVATLAAGEALDTVHRALDEVAVGSGVADPTRLIGEADRAIARLQALRLDLVRAADRAQVSAASGASGTAAWLASATRA
ncbi:MAG TPA: hypothetical protein VGN48_18225, partial [Pedococcus sp.]|nr:hypothetical protein [Pedococcus sp.]